MNARSHDSSYFVAGGTLSSAVPSYVARRADDELLSALRAGEFAYILTSRQMGKSSLMVRTIGKLRAEGVIAIVLDLSALGQNVTPEQWYYGLAERTADQTIGLEAFEALWISGANLGPLQRWIRVVEQIVRRSADRRMVVFIDEIDAVLSLPFRTDELFAAIRGLYNARTEKPEFRELTFCLLGVAAPSDLIHDPRTTPFNIGRRIELCDFTEDEATALGHGLSGDPSEQIRKLRRVFHWTHGHPYLSQRLCQEITREARGDSANGVDHACRQVFYTSRARERDDNLLFVRERILGAEVDRSALLSLYLQILRGKRINEVESDSLQSVLRLSGVVVADNGRLRVRNRLYRDAFNKHWALENMPDAEMRRQRAAYRKGFQRAMTVAAAMVLAVIVLAYAVMTGRGHSPRVGAYAYVANNGDSSVSYIDTETNSLVGTATGHGLGLVPTGVAVDPAGARVLVTNQFSNTITVLDAAQPKVLASFDVGLNPVGVSFHPNGRVAYVAVAGTNSVAVVDTSNLHVVKTIPVGPVPIRIAFSPTGTRAYVSEQNSDHIAVIDTQAETVITRVAVGWLPTTIVVSPDGRLAYINVGGVNKIAVLDTETNSVTAWIENVTGPLGSTISPDGATIYAVSEIARSVYVIDTKTRTVSAKITDAKLTSPGDAVFSNDGKWVYVTNSSGNNVAVISTQTRRVEHFLSVGKSPTLIAITRKREKSMGAS